MRISRSNYLTFLDKSNGQDGRLHNGPQQCTGTSAPRKLWRSVGECGPNFAAFRSCPRCVTAQRLTFLDPVAACGAQGWGPFGISPSQQSAFRRILGPRWRVRVRLFDAHSTVSMAHMEYILWELMKSIWDSGIQDELAWASGGRCEFSYSFWAGRTYR